MKKIIYVRNCTTCKNHNIKGVWHCWSGNKSLGFCNYNDTPNPNSVCYNSNKYTIGVKRKDIENIR